MTAEVKLLAIRKGFDMNIRIGKMLEECFLFGRNELCRERGRYAKNTNYPYTLIIVAPGMTSET